MGRTAPEIIARVRRPDLTEEERARRMKAIQAAAAALIISIERKGKKC